MLEGKTSAALKLITGHQCGCLLQLNDQIDPSNPNCLVRDILKEKHPPAQPLSQDCLISQVSESAPFHPIIFEALNGPMIRSAALRTFVLPVPQVLMLGAGAVFVPPFMLHPMTCEAMALLLTSYVPFTCHPFYFLPFYPAG